MIVWQKLLLAVLAAAAAAATEALVAEALKQHQRNRQHAGR